MISLPINNRYTTGHSNQQQGKVVIRDRWPPRTARDRWPPRTASLRLSEKKISWNEIL